jgi:hypothetical protein
MVGKANKDDLHGKHLVLFTQQTPDFCYSASASHPTRRFVQWSISEGVFSISLRSCVRRGLFCSFLYILAVVNCRSSRCRHLTGSGMELTLSRGGPNTRVHGTYHLVRQDPGLKRPTPTHQRRHPWIPTQMLKNESRSRVLRPTPYCILYSGFPCQSLSYCRRLVNLMTPAGVSSRFASSIPPFRVGVGDSPCVSPLRNLGVKSSDLPRLFWYAGRRKNPPTSTN